MEKKSLIKLSQSSLKAVIALLFTTFTCLGSQQAYAKPPTGVSTFHSISIYWTPNSIDSSKKVLVKYKITGTGQWYQGFPMSYSHIANAGTHQKSLYRGSIVNLTPNTSYDISLTQEGENGESANFTQITLSEKFPGKNVLSLTANRKTPIQISESGTPDNYKIYDGNNFTLDLGLNYPDAITVNANYIIIRNFNIKNTTDNGIKINGLIHHIVIEGCDISKWGSRNDGSWTYNNGTPNDPSDDISGKNQTDKTNFGKPNQSAIYVYNTWEGPAASNLVIQRNKIHHPNYDTNNWNEPYGSPYNHDKGMHPNGPGAIFFLNSGGNNIIRFNEIYSDEEHFFNDGIGGGVNTSFLGYPGSDSDIYGNYVSFCQDDAFEMEGGVVNVRVWNNFVENTLQGIANACVKIGPLYVWRNIYGKGTTVVGGGRSSLYGIKMGYSGGIKNATGDQYFFNNTYLQPNDEGYGGFGTTGSNDSNRGILHITSRNNIIQARSSAQQAISRGEDNIDNDFDYDLISTPKSSFPEGQELHGISGLPIYVDGWGFKGTAGNSALSGVYGLNTDSPGKDAAEIINNFSDIYLGKGPDVGAHENLSDPISFGIKANFIPMQLKPNKIVFSSPMNKKFGDKPFKLAASATSGAPVTYQLISGPAKLSGSTLTLTGSGKIVVKANTTANGIYAANDCEQVITINDI